jgi:hypothetical protein
MTSAPLARRLLPLVMLLVAAIPSCKREPSSARPPAATTDASLPTADGRPAKPKATSRRADGRSSFAPAELPAAVERGPLLARLPKSTLLAIRLPRVDKLLDAWKRTPVQKLLQLPQFAPQRTQLDAGLAQMRAELAKNVADFDAIEKKVRSIQGEAVLAIVSLDGRALAAGGGDAWPVTGALLFDAGKQGDDVDALLQRLFAEIERKEPGKKLAVVSTGAGKWHRRVEADGGAIDVARDGGQFTLKFGPAGGGGSGEEPMPARPLEDSFAAADVVRATPDLSKSGSTTFAELFVNLAPIWAAIDVLAPADAKEILAACGATSIAGISVTAGLGRSGIDEEMLILSPGGKDLLTQVLTNRPMDPRLAMFVPADAASASLGTFDFTALFDGVMKMMPAAKKRETDAQLEGMKASGFDLRGDLLGNIGPTFGFVGDADFARLMAPHGPAATGLDMTLLVELQDSPRFKRMLDRLLRSSGVAAHVRPGMVQGLTTASLEAVPLPGPDGEPFAVVEPCWHVGEHALVFATSAASLERALAASRDASNRGPKAMRDALEQHRTSAFAISAAAAADASAAQLALGRRTGFGLSVTSHEGPGTTSAVMLAAGAGFVSAIAIPKLIESRNQANEKVVLGSLHAIASAQSEFRARAFVDQDGDGRGEFGTLGELTGAAALAGGRPALVPPLLSSSMTPDARGCFVKGGYVFRVDVPRRIVGATDLAEQRFVAYAWPLAEGNGAGKVYVIDAEGKIFFSDNGASSQGYHGSDHAPASDASELRDVGDRVAGVTAVRRGRDGGIWLELE